jgi:hypothetical protein
VVPLRKTNKHDPQAPRFNKDVLATLVGWSSSIQPPHQGRPTLSTVPNIKTICDPRTRVLCSQPPCSTGIRKTKPDLAWNSTIHARDPVWGLCYPHCPCKVKLTKLSFWASPCYSMFPFKVQLFRGCKSETEPINTKSVVQHVIRYQVFLATYYKVGTKYQVICVYSEIYE